MKLSNFTLCLFFLLAGLLIGNHMGDQATLRDCATQSKATMMGGGTVLCSVEKKS